MSKSELMLLLKPLSDSTTAHSERRCQQQLPWSSPQHPQAPSTLPHIQSPHPTPRHQGALLLAPALWPCACPVALHLPCGLPTDRFVPLRSIFHTAARGTLQKYQCHPVAPLLKSLPCHAGLRCFHGVRLCNPMNCSPPGSSVLSGSPSLQNPAPRPRPSQTGPWDPACSLVCCNKPISV